MKNTCELLSPAMTVNDAIQKYPRSVAIFQRVGIDACCGGALPLGEAARRHHVDMNKLMMEILESDAEET